jgi:hypothetical protein
MFEPILVEWWHVLLAVGAVYELGFYRGVKSAESHYENEDTRQSDAYMFSVEEKNGTFYGYDMDSGEFLGQNSNVEDLTKQVRDKVPGYRYYMAMGKNEDKKDESV